ncbi:MAG TPA: TonB family protein [Bryobacteraceae bacterium]|nr:TonB family protein [Bryobacteraceae bacterium]
MDATQILGNITAYALQVGLFVGIGAAIPALVGFRNGRAPGARLLYWQVLLVACIALPWLRPWQTEVVTVSREALAAATISSGPAVPAGARYVLPSPAAIALLILAAGAALRALWLLFGFLKLARHRRRGIELPLPPEWNGMAGGVAVMISEEVEGPVTFGFFHPVVLLPASFREMPKAMRDAILSHELLHVARHDWVFTLAEEFVRCAFWFHPAIWWTLGEIQLAREQTVDQAVIQMTQARDPYVDTLLAMAGAASIEPDLAPAPSFLRRRHLKQRVIGLIQETPMSKTRKLFAQASAIALMAAASWFVTAAIPLHAQSQTVTDGPGVTVNLAGVQMLHRPPIYYPGKAFADGVEGTVVVQAHVDAKGEVIDDSILSGPDELRKDVQQAILSWHFDASTGGATRVVNITFAKPAQPAVPAVDMLPMPSTSPAPPPAAVRFMAQSQLAPPTAAPSPKVNQIVVRGLPDEAADRLRTELPVHVGDTYTPDLRRKTLDVAHQFDEHLQLGMSDTAGEATLTITAPYAAAADGPAAVAAQRVGANVQAANLISAERPVYPPLAKMARQQGTVSFEATIGTNGAVEDLKVLPGAPPLLVQAATNAVKTWVYRPTLLNGVPTRVVTTVSVNFSLSDSPFPAAQ